MRRATALAATGAALLAGCGGTTTSTTDRVVTEGGAGAVTDSTIERTVTRTAPTTTVTVPPSTATTPARPAVPPTGTGTGTGTTPAGPGRRAPLPAPYADAFDADAVTLDRLITEQQHGTDARDRITAVRGRLSRRRARLARSGGDSPAAALLQTAAAEALAAVAAGDGPRLARQHAAITAARARLTAERAGG